MGITATDHGLRRDLQRAHLRVTAARLAVLTLLRERGRPLSHLEVTEALSGRGFDRATLYRNLVELTRAGLARRTELGDRVWRFEDSRTDPAARDHPHFVCTACGQVQCLPPTAVALRGSGRAPRAVSRGEVEVQLRGRCDRCRED